MKITNKKKLFIGTIGLTVATAAVATPIALNITNQEIQNPSFGHELKFMGKTFTSKSQLLSYINNNSKKIMQAAGSGIYSAKIGNDIVDFYTYKDAMDFIKKHIVSEEVYLKPGVENMKLTSIGPDSFIKTKSTRKYVVFKKYNADFDKRATTGVMEHSYTFALLPRESDTQKRKDLLRYKIEEARIEAAKSYIQVHTSFYFNGIYFKTINDLRRYMNQNRKTFFKKINGNSTYSIINTERGLLKFDSKSKDLAKNKDFRRKIQDFAVPYYNVAPDGQPAKWIRANQGNIPQIAASLKDENLRYIKVNSNNDTATEVVDMDSSTPNGMLYGNYFVKSGLGMEEAKKKSNWKEERDIKASSSKELVDITILKSIINYAFDSHKIKNLVYLIAQTKLDKSSGATFSDFLSSTNYFKRKEGYMKDVSKLIISLSHGVRHNFLDSIITTHSFLINKMIKNNENSEDIIKVAQYFDSISKIMDSFIAPLILPFVVNKKNGEKLKNFKFEYFSNAFKFYDKNSLGLGINFQSNPYSYYKKLLGNDNQTKDHLQRKVYFQILKASMGMNSIMLTGLRHNQNVYSEWEQNQIIKIKDAHRYKDSLNATNPNFNELNIPLENLSFSKKRKDSSLWDFSFDGLQNSSPDSKEWVSIWNNLNQIKDSIKINNIKIAPDTIMKNANNYIMNFQNKAIDKYKETISKKKNLILGKYGNTQEEFQENDFNTNTFAMIPISPEQTNLLKTGRSLASSYDGYQYLKNMIASAVIPLRERVKDFLTNVGTFAGQAALAVATAGASAEGMAVKEAMVKPSKKTSAWAFKSAKSKLGQFVKMDTKDKLDTTDKIFKSFPTGTIKDSPATSFLKEIQLMTNPAFGLLSMLGGEYAKLINDYMDISISIVKNVIPGFSMIMGIFDNFNKTERQTYKFKAAEDGTQLLWNGGQVDYSWWGLKSEQVYSIKDLKIIISPEIISGFSDSEDGYYYGNKIHSDLSALRFYMAQKKIDSLLNKDRAKFLQNNEDKIKWGLPLENQNDSKVAKYDKLEDLITNTALLASKDTISKKIYVSGSGLQSSSDITWNSNLETFLNNQKRVLIIKMPKTINGELQQEKNFELPKPFYKNGAVMKKDPGDLMDYSRYITLNPNLVIKGKDEREKIKSIAGNVDLNDSKIYKKYKKILNTLESVANYDHFSTIESLNDLIKRYAVGLRIDSKEVIYEVLNDPQNLLVNSKIKSATKGSYEYLDNSWTNQTKTIYKINAKNGEIKYFLSKREALLELKNNEFKIYLTSLQRDSMKYLFNGMVFNSISEIYDYIIKMSGGNNEQK
ncbi:MAG: hypothetical protein HRT98_04500 [Mycoplasmatales bacterium]|nr:hypothetical protein [Mycoplasmatales bacterium]